MTPAEVDALIARLNQAAIVKRELGDTWIADDLMKAAAALAAMQERIAEIEDERETYRRAWVREEAARMAERDTFYMDYRMKCDEETKAQAQRIAKLLACVEAANAMRETMNEGATCVGPRELDAYDRASAALEQT